jgi:hypothetical protein
MKWGKLKRVRRSAGRTAKKANLSKSLTVYRFNLTKEKLAALTRAERRLLLLLGHAANEINVLSKLILMSGQSQPATKMEDYVIAGQTLILMRLLMGKLHEAWELFTKRFQKDRELSRQYLRLLEPEATAALQNLKQHFGKGSTLTQVRKNFAFHYADEGDLIETSFQDLPTSDIWDFYVSNIVANTFYYASELVVTNGVLALANVDGDNDEQRRHLRDQARFHRVCDLVIKVSDQLTVLFRGCIIAILQTNFGNEIKRKSIKLTGVPRLTTVTIPFFVDEREFLKRAATTSSVIK